MKILVLSVLCCFALAMDGAAQNTPTSHEVAIGDITSVEGIRENPLIGYGVVVGLNGTGDRQQTIFTTQTLTGMLQRLGVQVSPTTMMVKNVAAVMVTATLPPFAVHGGKVDVTVSSMGDAKSLEGGLLLMTPLYGVDAQVYAEAQGPIALGGYTASSGGSTKQLNHPTVGRIPGGGLIERDLAIRLDDRDTVTLLLREPEFLVAEEIAHAINARLGSRGTRAVDARQIEVCVPPGMPVPELLALVEGLQVTMRTRAKIVINERTGTVVMGSDAQIGAVSILHGNLSIEVSKNFSVSQPAPFSTGTTAVTSDTAVTAQDSPARLIELKEGATVAQLVEGLQKIGATARDVVAILQAMKAAGAIQAELEIL